MKTTFIFVQIEHGQTLGLLILNVGNALRINQVVTASFLAALQQMGLELSNTPIRENLMKTFADFRQVIHQHGVFLMSTGLEVHVDTVFGQGAGHQLTVGREDIATVRSDRNAFAHEAVGHVFPVALLGKHDEAGLDYHRYPRERHQQHDEEVAGHYVFFVYSHGVRCGLWFYFIR